MHLLLHKLFLKHWNCDWPLSLDNPLNDLINHILNRLQNFFHSLNVSYICPWHFNYLELSFDDNLILPWDIDWPILLAYDLNFCRHIYSFALLDDLIYWHIAILSIYHWLLDMFNQVYRNLLDQIYRELLSYRYTILVMNDLSLFKLLDCCSFLLYNEPLRDCNDRIDYLLDVFGNLDHLRNRSEES